MHKGSPLPRGKPSMLAGLFRRHPTSAGIDPAEPALVETRIAPNPDPDTPSQVFRLLLASDSATDGNDVAQRIHTLWPQSAVTIRGLSAPLARDDLSATAILVDCRHDHEAVMRIMGEIDLLGPTVRPAIILLIAQSENDKNWALAIGADSILPCPFTDVDLRLLFGSAGKVSGLNLENRRLRQSLDALAQDAQRLRTLAYTDHLTGLPNRLYLTSWLSEVMARSDAELGFAVHMLDLDGFKQTNDQYGHRAGDQLLCQLGDRVTRLSRRLDLVVRLGGDEIAVVQVGVETAGDCRAFLSRLSAMFELPFEIGSLLIGVDASIGTAIYPADGATLSELLHHADMAMYGAKPAGSRRARRDRGSERESADQALIKTATFTLAFDLKDGTLTGVLCEAERSGAPDPFRDLKVAMIQCAGWTGHGPAVIFSAAVSNGALNDEHAVSSLRDMLAETGADARACEIRLLAADLAHDGEICHQLRELGFQIAVQVDTETFSPQRLLRIPLSRLHLARSFAELDSGLKPFRILLDLAVVFARASDIRTLAHGVRTAEQMEALRKIGVDALTGPIVGISIDDVGLQSVRQRLIKQTRSATSD